MSTRTEVDLLGDLQLADELYYGIHTQRAVNNFNISGSRIGDYPLFIQGMVYTKKT